MLLHASSRPHRLPATATSLRLHHRKSCSYAHTVAIPLGVLSWGVEKKAQRRTDRHPEFPMEVRAEIAIQRPGISPSGDCNRSIGRCSAKTSRWGPCSNKRSCSRCEIWLAFLRGFGGAIPRSHVAPVWDNRMRHGDPHTHHRTRSLSQKGTTPTHTDTLKVSLSRRPGQQMSRVETGRLPK